MGTRVLVEVRGGNIQRAVATSDVTLQVIDHDNIQQASTREELIRNVSEAVIPLEHQVEDQVDFIAIMEEIIKQYDELKKELPHERTNKPG